MDRRDRALAVLLFAAGSVVLGAGAFFGLPPSKGVLGALRVLDGQVPYRDFWTVYAPGQFYAIAGLFRVFGEEVVVQGLCVGLLRAATGALLYVLLRRLAAPRSAALAVAILAMAQAWEVAPELDSYPPALFFGVLALVGLEAHVRSGGLGTALLAGVSLGLAACFKHDVAAYLAVACALGVALGSRLADAPFPVRPLRTGLALAAGALAVAAPVVVALAVACGHDAWEDLVVFPATDFRVIRSEPWPPLLPPFEPWGEWLAEPGDLAALRDALRLSGRVVLSHVPEVAWLAGTALALRARGRLAPARALGAGVALVGVPLYWWAAHTQPNTHLVSMAVLSWVLGAAVLPRTRAGRFAAAAFLAAWGVGFLSEPAESAGRLALGWRDRVALDLPRARGIRVSGREAAYFRPIVAWIRENVPPGEPIYCGVARHDLPVLGNLRFHVLSERLPAHRTHEIHPGITDDERRQRETIARLDEHGVRCAVLWRFGGDDPVWAHQHLEPRRLMRRALHPEWGSDLLDRWLAENFEPVMEIDEYVLLRRRE